MQRAFNSTIKIKMRPCKSCGRNSHIFSRGRCSDCARQEDNRDEPEDTEEDLKDLIADADILHSRYIRLKYADRNGNCECYTCGTVGRWQDMDCAHYISRGCYFLRWDERNTKVCCQTCNRTKYGNMPAYGKRLELESPNLTEILLEESRLVWKIDRAEVRRVISELPDKIKKLESLIHG